MAYWRLHYHLVWATYQRNPWLTGDVERMVYGTLLGKAQELDIIIHQIGNTDDHVHVVASIPPKIAVADCVRHFKGASSRYVNVNAGLDFQFKWQGGYGAISFGERSMEFVVAYARDQRQHHAQQTAIAYYERMTEEDDGPAFAEPDRNPLGLHLLSRRLPATGGSSRPSTRYNRESDECFPIAVTPANGCT